MKSNYVNPYERSNQYKVGEPTASRLDFKGTSSSRRVHTEAYDVSDIQDKGASNKIQFSLASYKNYLPSKSTKKTNYPSYLDYKKSTQPPSEPINVQSKPMPTRTGGIRLSKDIMDNYKISQPSKLFSGKNEDYKKHARIKTEAFEQTISDKIAQMYSKMNSAGMGFTKEKAQKPALEPEKNYKIEETAGKGTFGVVYKATSLITGDPVAIKKVLQDKRYKNRELQIMKMLHHPNLLEIKDHYYTKQGGQEYLNVVMDYFQENLYNYNRSYTRKKENIPPILIKIYSYQLFKAINYLSALSIAHRDIKPHNILIDPNNHKLVICDFGSAKQLVATESNLAYICSRCYRAPQLIFGATDYTSQIDVWSIGCVIVEMINGDPPFLGDSQIDQLIQIIKVLGTPSKITALEMNKNYDMKEYKYPIVNAKDWKKILKPKTDPLLVDLVTKVMQYSPTRRLTPFEAMCHPYFDDLRDKAKYQQIVMMTGCKDLLRFGKQQSVVSKDFIEKLVPAWYSR